MAINAMHSRLSSAFLMYRQHGRERAPGSALPDGGRTGQEQTKQCIGCCDSGGAMLLVF